MSKAHLDLRKVDREGWFRKYGGNPLKYRDQCKSGYRGPVNQAHHILPGTSVKESEGQSGKNARFIKEVEWITKWNINNSENLIGMPQLWTYSLYFEEKGSEALRGEFNRRYWGGLVRKQKKQKFGSQSPEHYPIHNPTSFGHLEYNDKVCASIVQKVWSHVQEKQKSHEVDVESVADALVKLQTKWRNYLVRRGAPAVKTVWDRMIEGDKVALVPFTMANVPHPLA